MAGDYLSEFTTKFSDNSKTKEVTSKDYRGGVKNSNNNNVASFLGNSANTNTNVVPNADQFGKDSTSKKDVSIQPYPNPSKSAEGKSENNYKPNFQGGVAGTDYPDPNNGSIQVHANGTKTQITANGERIEWGTDEALQSAIKSQEDKKYSVTNQREIDYNTNLPSDFDPGGKDSLSHAQYLCSIGVDYFCQQAKGLQNTYG